MTSDPRRGDHRSGGPEGPLDVEFIRWLLRLVEEGTLEAPGPVGAGLVRRLQGAATVLELIERASSPLVHVEVDQDAAGSSVRLRRGERVVTVAAGLEMARAAELSEQLVNLFAPDG